MSAKLITDNYKQVKRTTVQSKRKQDDVSAGTSGIKREQQQDLEILKGFDLTLEYGPCIGISRMERWDRAEKHGLCPPKEVRDLILRHNDDDLYTKCLWSDYNI